MHGPLNVKFFNPLYDAALCTLAIKDKLWQAK